MSICKDCLHYEICDEYVSPHESFPEVEGGCRCFRDKTEPKGLILKVGNVTGYFPKEFIVEAIETHISIVRCKECKRWTPSKRYGTDHNDVKRYYGECVVTHRSEREDHYCSYGGRREDGT